MVLTVNFLLRESLQDTFWNSLPDTFWNSLQGTFWNSLQDPFWNSLQDTFIFHGLFLLSLRLHRSSRLRNPLQSPETIAATICSNFSTSFKFWFQLKRGPGGGAPRFRRVQGAQPPRVPGAQLPGFAGGPGAQPPGNGRVFVQVRGNWIENVVSLIYLQQWFYAGVQGRSPRETLEYFFKCVEIGQTTLSLSFTCSNDSMRVSGGAAPGKR